ncbi:MAG: hypothetical protein JWM10_2198 [Myxococcaceae bacterium]|nr:hypothetical protein [Myxococcaceae bacterium]
MRDRLRYSTSPARAFDRALGGARSVGAAARLLLDRSSSPISDYNQIANLFYTPEALQVAVDTLSAVPSSRRALAAREPLGRVPMAMLEACPAGSLGRELWVAERRVGVTGAYLPGLPGEVRVPERADHAYVLRHYYETHDIWHVATGFPMTIPGEAGIHAFTAAQFPSRMDLVLVAMVLAQTALRKYERRREPMDWVARGWFFGQSVAPLFGVDWQSRWTSPVTDVRRELGLPEGGIPAADRY